MADWRVVVPHMHPGYIDWEGFKANQKRLGDNAQAFSVTPDRSAKDPPCSKAKFSAVCVARA